MSLTVDCAELIEEPALDADPITLSRTPPTAPVKRPSGFLARLRAGMAGTVHVPKGVDLTEPTGEVWDAERS